MYQFSSRLKSFSFALMVLGILGIGYGFWSAPKTDEDVEAILKEQEAHHGGAHHDTHTEATHSDASHEEHTNAEAHSSHEASTHKVESADTVSHEVAHVAVDSAAHSAHDSTVVAIAPVVTNSKSDIYVSKFHKEIVDHEAEHQEHVAHVKHQLQNKPWSALYVACIFFMLIAVGALAFYAIQWVAQAGWSPMLFRVMEGITAYVLPGSIIFFILLALAGFHFNHMFTWMSDGVSDPNSPNYDHIIAGKSGFLNVPFFLIRASIYLIGWNLFRYVSRKNSIKLDETKDMSFFRKNYNAAAMFLVFFIISESMMSWDWIMSVDPHWYSTLFGWYVFASFFVSGITMITLTTIYLKNKGLLPEVNKSHLHDLAKFMFGISVFWTYLWFSQFMLMWYSNIPEEVTYFVTRIENYNLPFFGMVVMNFVFPLLILMNADFKRLQWVVVMAGIVILAGHYVDFFNMIMPATVGDQWFIGVSEISSVLFFAGLFIFVVFTALTKAPLASEGNPYIEESKHFHY
ncbi:quinol:cytochrome C oxidoreductase [Flavobacterium sp.]|uniref:quinol:cytochrome C oxidoreductase n=1 Tax=Flavobacterium sp. TaxID=239 RepID=UPI0037C071F4